MGLIGGWGAGGRNGGEGWESGEGSKGSREGAWRLVAVQTLLCSNICSFFQTVVCLLEHSDGNSLLCSIGHCPLWIRCPKGKKGKKTDPRYKLKTHKIASLNAVGGYQTSSVDLGRVDGNTIYGLCSTKIKTTSTVIRSLYLI